MTEFERNQRLMDSSVWLSYLINGNNKNVIETNEIFLLSSLSLFEIKKKMISYKIDKENIIKMMNFIKKRSIIIPVNDKIAEKASEISFEKNLPAVDSLIYTSAILNNAKLITLDNDFRGLKEVLIL